MRLHRTDIHLTHNINYLVRLLRIIIGLFFFEFNTDLVGGCIGCFLSHWGLIDCNICGGRLVLLAGILDFVWALPLDEGAGPSSLQGAASLFLNGIHTVHDAHFVGLFHCWGLGLLGLGFFFLFLSIVYLIDFWELLVIELVLEILGLTGLDFGDAADCLDLVLAREEGSSLLFDQVWTLWSCIWNLDFLRPLRLLYGTELVWVFLL